MTQVAQDFSIFQNEPKSLVFTLPTGDYSGVASGEWAAFEKFGFSPVIQKTGGSVVTDDSNDNVTVTLVSGDTEGLEGDYFHELDLFDGSGNPIVSAIGTLTVSERAIKT